MQTTTETFHLPDIHRDWPLTQQTNPEHPTIALQSSEWLESFNVFTPKQIAKFRAIRIDLLASFAYPNHLPEHFKASCNLLILLFAMDEISDKMSKEEAISLAALAMDALRYSEAPKKNDEHPIGEVHRAFWKDVIKLGNSLVTDRFIQSYERCMQAMIQEACDRENRAIAQTFEEYLKLRQYTGAVKPSFDFLLLPLEIPKELLDHPIIIEIERMAVLLVSVANDIVSFNVEQARGDIHNAVIVIMNEHDWPVQVAMDTVGEWYRAQSISLLSKCEIEVAVVWENQPQAKGALETYVWGLLNWVTANYEWSFGSRRFFETGNNDKIRQDGVVLLLPRKVSVPHKRTLT